ncbi:hypothetical protein PPACK8108_LOCUS138 [Phakopsora pachyrhizi]|uniref:Uncharacterized protein n=1 Tax=Phakopsora pachyrhizi TaxID=170000 RepID=A0AAV0ACY0_PHAPC|nr:hypothetical protein PPACK8108_LOCUS138 [Phakopsora pachyrhizi]
MKLKMLQVMDSRTTTIDPIIQELATQVVNEDPDNAYQFDNPNAFYGPDNTEPCACVDYATKSLIQV